MNILLIFVPGLLIGALIVYFVLKKNNPSKVSEELEQKLRDSIPEALKPLIEQLITMADQKLGAEKQEIKTDMDNKRVAIEKLVKQISDDLEKRNKKLDESDKERIGSFHALKQALDGQKEITEKLSDTTEALRSVLSNNQLRGQFGEEVAENLLKMSGFVKGTDYESNKSQGNNTRPDFTIFLPDKVKINVDSKFPYTNLQKVAEAKDTTTKRQYIKLFEADIKEKIKQITTREYINPEENTVDFVVLFVPNEMIFSYIYDKMNEIWMDGMRKKVIFAGPFSFTAILRLVRQSYDNFKYKKDLHKIIIDIKVFEQEFKKFNEEFEKIGDKIHSAVEQYDRVNTTRKNQLNRSIDKIVLEDSAQELLVEENTN